MRFISFFKHINLRQKLIIIVVLFILLPLTTAGMFFYYSSERYVVERTNTETVQILTLLQNNVDQLLQSYEEQFMLIYQFDDVIKQLGGSESTTPKTEDTINKFFRDFLRGKDEFESIYLFPEHSNQIYFYDPKGSKLFMEQVQLYPEWIRTLKDSKGRVEWINTYELPPNQYSSRSRYYFIAGMPIKDIFGVLQPLGTVLVNIKIEALSKIMEGIQVSPNGFTMLIDAQGHVIWHRNSEILGSDGIRNLPLFEQVIAEKQGVTSQKFNGQAYQMSYVQSDFNGWYYLSFVPHSDLQAETENIKKFLVLTIMISIVIFSLLASLTTVYITLPLRRIVVAMNRFGKNSLRVKLDVNSKDEIGILKQAFNSMSYKIHDLIEEVRTVTIKEKESELKALQAQINPHFVYNSLDTINWMAIEKKEKEISHMITALSDIMRYAISSGNNLVSIKEELKWAENYIYIQKNRFEDRFHVEFMIDPDALPYKIPRLLLQPFIENAILHGLEQREEGGLIKIKAVMEQNRNDRIVFVVEDNGIGMSEETLQQIYDHKNSGIGIRNIDDRLKMQYGVEYGVLIESQLERGTKVTITVPRLLN